MERPIKSKRKLKPTKLPQGCLYCGESNPWINITVSLVAPFRGRNYSIHSEVSQCRHCDAIVTTEHQSEATLAKTREAHGRWISEHFRKAQKQLGLSLRQLAAETAIPFATLGRISSGEHFIEANTEKLLLMELDRLIHLQSVSWLIRLEQHWSSTIDGSVILQCDPKASHVYSPALKTAAFSPLSCKAVSDEQERDCDISSCGKFVPAYA